MCRTGLFWPAEPGTKWIRSATLSNRTAQNYKISVKRWPPDNLVTLMTEASMGARAKLSSSLCIRVVCSAAASAAAELTTMCHRFRYHIGTYLNIEGTFLSFPQLSRIFSFFLKKQSHGIYRFFHFRLSTFSQFSSFFLFMFLFSDLFSSCPTLLEKGCTVNCTSFTEHRL